MLFLFDWDNFHLLLFIILFFQVISQLRILGRAVTAGCKFDREIWSNELSPVLNLWKKLNQVSTGISFWFFSPFFFFFLFHLQIVHVGKIWHYSVLNMSNILELDRGENSNRSRSAKEAVSPVSFVFFWSCAMSSIPTIFLVTPCLLSLQSLLLKVKCFSGVKVLRKNNISSGFHLFLYCRVSYINNYRIFACSLGKVRVL